MKVGNRRHCDGCKNVILEVDSYYSGTRADSIDLCLPCGRVAPHLASQLALQVPDSEAS